MSDVDSLTKYKIITMGIEQWLDHIPENVSVRKLPGKMLYCAATNEFYFYGDSKIFQISVSVTPPPQPGEKEGR